MEQELKSQQRMGKEQDAQMTSQLQQLRERERELELEKIESERKAISLQR